MGNEIIIECMRCGNPLSDVQIKRGNKYCSRECNEKRRSTYRSDQIRYCLFCKTKRLTKQQVWSNNKYCSKKCSDLDHRMKADDLAKADPKARKSYITKNAQVEIKTYFSEEELAHCWYCDHKTIEICHIKPRREFPKNASYEEINAKDNILILCPNHHREFDSGVLTKEEVFRKKNEVSNQTRFVLSEPKDSFRISEEEWISGIQIPTEVSSAEMVSSARLLPISLQAFV